MPREAAGEAEMAEELEAPAGGETPPLETAPGPEVTPEDTAPAPQPAPTVDEEAPGVDALVGRLASGAATANDQEMVRRLYGHTDEIKTLKAELETTKGADPLADLAEAYIREECRGDPTLVAQHRRWIAQTPGGSRDYIDAVNQRRLDVARGGGEAPQETEEQAQARRIREEVNRQLQPDRERAQKEQTTTTFVTTLDGALQGMTLRPEVAAAVREELMGALTAWLKTPLENFNEFLGVPKGTQMADHVQKRATRLQTLIDAAQAGKKPAAAALPALPAAPRPPPRPDDGEETTCEEDAMAVIREIDAKSESGGGAS